MAQCLFQELAYKEKRTLVLQDVIFGGSSEFHIGTLPVLLCWFSGIRIVLMRIDRESDPNEGRSMLVSSENLDLG
jgi:hypothetical protein